MIEFKYTPDEDVKLHAEGAIQLIASTFQSHENGLPEWLKNSADAYVREDALEKKRIIFIIFDYGRKNIKPSISCLDFSGMTSIMIEENFRIWADPNAAKRDAMTFSIQGGHGNGGKSYMTKMFEDYAMIYTVKKGKKNCYGVKGGSFRFGYIPDKENGRDLSSSNLKVELDKVLKQHKCNFNNLPEDAKEAINLADGFSIVTGVGPKGYKNQIPATHLISSLQEHPQMIKTMELCKVFAIINGHLYKNGKQLQLPPIKPINGAEEPKIFEIPEMLKDPISEDKISTTDNNKLPPGKLELRTSNVRMWRSGKAQRHIIAYKSQSGYIGSVAVSELDIQSTYRDRMYGECYLESLESFKLNDRSRLTDSTLTRAVKYFISKCVQSYAKEFEDLERYKYNQEEKNAISKINEALDSWKNRFLSEFMQGLWGNNGNGPPPPPPPLPSGKPSRIEVMLSHNIAGLGIAFRPNIKFFDQEGKQIRPVPFMWYSDDNNVAMVNEDLMVINTFSYGQTYIYAETLDGNICSNKVPLEIARINEINIMPKEVQLDVGSRQKFNAECLLPNNEKISNIYLLWMVNKPYVAKVSSSGLVYGFAPGETEVFAGDDHCIAKNPSIIKVSIGKGTGGKGYPRVFVSGEIDCDPNTNEFVYLTKDYPPVWQRAEDVDRNIWWINSSAPLAHLYLNINKGYGYQSREWRMYHLERYIDIIVQIALTYGPTDNVSLSSNDWIMQWGAHVSEIQAAAVADLIDFINNGELPESET